MSTQLVLRYPILEVRPNVVAYLDLRFAAPGAPIEVTFLVHLIFLQLKSGARHSRLHLHHRVLLALTCILARLLGAVVDSGDARCSLQYQFEERRSGGGVDS